MERILHPRLGAGLMGVVCLAALLLSLGCRDRSETRLNLLVVTLDTTRSDHLGIYGYDRDTTPELAELAAQSVVFDSAFAQETSTAPSHASMFTGQYPFNHGVMANEFRLAEESATLAAIVSDAGYTTGGFVSGWTMAARTSGLDRGFDIYDDEIADARRQGADTVLRALDWLQAEQREPFFLFVHLFDAHGPYSSPPEFQQMFESDDPGRPLQEIPPYQQMSDSEGNPIDTVGPYVDLYDGSIRFEDNLVAALLDAIDLETTVVVVAADHGESLAERYWSVDHGGHVFDEQTKIPLLIHVPGFDSRRVDSLVETVDLMPTLLHLLEVDLPADAAIAGRSLVPLMTGDRSDWRQVVFSSARAVSERHADRGYELNSGRKIYSARSKNWKLINYPGIEEDYWELYDLQNDPLEEVNVADENPEKVEELRSALGAWLRTARRTSFQPVELSDEEREKLLALGYLE